MKESIKKGGYTYIKYLQNKTHLLRNDAYKDQGVEYYEIWASNKNHASYGLIYKNTHLEFCSAMLVDTKKPTAELLGAFKELEGII